MSGPAVRLTAPRRGARVLLAVVMSLALVAPIMPAVGSVSASAQEDPAPPATGEAVWRVQSQSWVQGWSGAQAFREIDFVTRGHGFALLDGSLGEPSLLETETGGRENVAGDAPWSVAYEEFATSTAAVEFTDEDTGVMVDLSPPTGSPVGKGIAQTSKGGRTWSIVHEETGFNDVTYTRDDGSGVVAVGGSGKILVSSDGGATWDPASVPASFSRELHAVAFAAGTGVGVAVGGTDDSDGAAILRTDDGGASWTELKSGTDGAFPPLSFVGLRGVELVETGEGILGVAVGDRGTLLISEDAGRKWDLAGPFTSPALSANATVKSRLPSLRSVAVAEATTDTLNGYVVGSNLTVLEMQDGRLDQWALAPVDGRAARFASTTLESVAIEPGGAGERAMAVGGQVMLERTLTDDAEETADDTWWRCIPEPEIEDGEDGDDPFGDLPTCASRGTAPEGQDPPDERGESTAAVSCEVDDTEGFPCRATWQPRAEDGTELEIDSFASVFFDDDVGGEGRRAVVWQPTSGSGNERILLFDPDTPSGGVDAEGRPIRGVQRGVSGFGDGAEPGVQNDDDAVDDDPAEFGGGSALGPQTGVVNLSDAPLVDADGEPLEGEDRSFRINNNVPVTYDDGGDRFYLATNTTGTAQEQVSGSASDVGEPPRIMAVSLTGKHPGVVTEIPAVVDSDAPDRANLELRNLAFDPRHSVLYAITETNPRQNRVDGSLLLSNDSSQVTVHAFEAEGANLERAWSLGIEDSCRTTTGLAEFGVSDDGDALSFACQGLSFPYFGNPSFTPNTIVTVRLRLRDRHPSELNPVNPNDVVVSTQAVAGKVRFEKNVTLDVGERNLLAWNQTAQGAGLWDYEVGGWVGIVPFETIAGMAGFGSGSEVAHPWRGRLYVTCGGGGAGCEFFDLDGDGERDEERPAVVVVDTLNVAAGRPANVAGSVPLFSAPSWEGGHVLAAVPPRAPRERPRLLFRSGTGAFHMFEDGVGPALPVSRPDPDDATNPDVPEAEASNVKRIGRASGYGARVWWTGLGTATALSCQQFVGSTASLTAGCGQPTLSYEWLTDPGAKTAGGNVPFGEHTSSVPGLPGGGQRELRLGEVQRADVEQDSFSARFDGKAVGLFYDGGPADSDRGATSEDVKRRRGRDAHLFADEEINWLADEFERGECGPREDPESDSSTTTTTDPCREKYDEFRERHEGEEDDPETEDDESAENPGFDGRFEPFEARLDEGVDRVWRELDGERRIEGGCASDPDPEREGEEGEVKDDPETPENEADCWREFDRNDPRCGRDDPETEADESSCFVDEDGEATDDERSSVEERGGLTYASACLEPQSQSSSFAGSEAVCDPDGEVTEASAGVGPFSLSPDDEATADMESAAEEAVSEFLSVGASGSRARSFVDDGLGMVVETTAFASDVDLRVPGGGSVSIGEVRTTARAHARGRPGTADSSVRVAYEDVVISDGDEEEVFACGRADPDAGPPAFDPSDPPQNQGEFEDQFGDPNGDGNDHDGDGSADGPNEEDVFWAAGLTPDERFEGEGGNASPVACDPHTVVDVISTVFAGKVAATTADPDSDEKTAGSPGGAQAIVRRDPVAVMSDFVINRIDGLWELPGLQLTVFNDGLRTNRIQVGLAAVYAESHYEIGQRRVEIPPSPGTVEVSLSDPQGSPLAGGTFALLEDVDGDGQLSAADTAVAECRTDAGGSCVFDDLDAGAYLVEQRRAPPGFLADEAPRPVFVSEGGFESLGFVNLPDSAAIEVLLVEPSGEPLEGGQFALVSDPEGTGTVEPSDAVAASCVTGGDGTCRFDRVSLGGWVLHQAAAPEGYQTADDIAFSLQRPGQVAQIRVVNGAEVAGATLRIIEIIDGTQSTSSTFAGGSTTGDDSWWAVLPRSLAALLQRGWIQALLFGLTGMLFGAPAYLAHRRRELAIATQRH